MNRTYIFCALILSAASMFAQNPGGSFSGRVTDQSGASVANATVTITAVAGNSTQKTVTGQDGTFSLSLPPGRYRIEIEKPGFRRSAAQDFDLATTAGPVTVKLQISSASESIEVIGQSPSVEAAGA